jgi:hypothetical protein
MDCIESLSAIRTPLPFVIPTKEGSRLAAIMLYDYSLFLSTFCLDAKSGAKKWRHPPAGGPPVLPACAQQHSKALIIANQLSFHFSSRALKDV